MSEWKMKGVAGKCGKCRGTTRLGVQRVCGEKKRVAGGCGEKGMVTV